ncbi:tetratricopeptide repeat protein [Acidicapsa dinghuensis]|uniref:Tetratricopeptide repeat protein n=1 Tax=Acidicapsa dinghuensis TaxID=2218256 RepID=A0ABW1ED23_9BACT|nr:tetratricopeptide repeat protein [Acidicapsa dinghuensis]
MTATAALCAGLTPEAIAQQNSASGSSTSDVTDSVGNGRILLVLPFDNLTETSSDHNSSVADSAGSAPNQAPRQAPNPATLEWIREAVPVVLNSRFASAGFLPLTREDRLYALDHLGLPETFEPSHAMALRIAQTLDANSLLLGDFRVNGNTLTLEARIIDVAKLRLSDPVTESGPLQQLIPLLNTLAWQLTRKLDPNFGVAEETFRAAGTNLRLDAFEQYIRGLTDPDIPEQISHLKKTLELSPDFTDAWLALGKAQFAANEYEQAAVSFDKVTKNDPAALEAGFYRGLSLIFSGNYPRADEAFAAVARELPLPEVVNNQGVAESRRGHDATALFRQAEAADPNDADYHFNLAVTLHRHGDTAGALAELAQVVKLRPNDSEAKSLQVAWQGQANPVTPGPEPLERIKRTYNGAEFRQASLIAEQVEETRLAVLPGPQRAAKLAGLAHEKLDRGLLLEAERSYQAALSADPHSAEAHAGLAEVRERAGDVDAARKEAQASLASQANVGAYLVLARLDLAANHLTEARDEAGQAVKLDSSNRAAKELRKTIDARIQGSPTGDPKPVGGSGPTTP